MSLIRCIVMLCCLAFVLTGCATTTDRLTEDEVVDLSGAWNDTDSQMVAEKMIDQVLSERWLSNFTMQNGKKPFVIVGNIRNKSHEHINLNTFIYEMERNLINSGQVRFVASESERERIRREREDMDIHAREDTRKSMGQEIGADFILLGEINTIIDTAGRKQVRYYQVNLDLISLKDNIKVWVGQKKIKKLVKNSKLRY